MNKVLKILGWLAAGAAEALKEIKK